MYVTVQRSSGPGLGAFAPRRLAIVAPRVYRRPGLGGLVLVAPRVRRFGLGGCAATDVACQAEENARASGVELNCEPQTITWPGGSSTSVMCGIPGSNQFAFSGDVIARPGGGAIVAADIGRSGGEFAGVRESPSIPDFSAYNAAIAAGQTPTQDLIRWSGTSSAPLIPAPAAIPAAAVPPPPAALPRVPAQAVIPAPAVFVPSAPAAPAPDLTPRGTLRSSDILEGNVTNMLGSTVPVFGFELPIWALVAGGVGLAYAFGGGGDGGRRR